MAGEIFVAIRSGDTARIAKLIADDPAVARERNASGVSAIMQARYQGRQAIVDLLRPAVGELDVFEAAALGDIARLDTLLNSDSELAQAYSGDGFTGLHLASYFAQADAARSLLRAGADPNAVATNGTKLAVINSAAASGSTELVTIILEAGANPNWQQDGGYTALHAAAQRKNLQMIKALLEAGADPAIRTNEGKTAADVGGPEVAALIKNPIRA